MEIMFWVLMGLYLIGFLLHFYKKYLDRKLKKKEELSQPKVIPFDINMDEAITILTRDGVFKIVKIHKFQEEASLKEWNEALKNLKRKERNQ